MALPYMEAMGEQAQAAELPPRMFHISVWMAYPKKAATFISGVGSDGEGKDFTFIKSQAAGSCASQSP